MDISTLVTISCVLTTIMMGFLAAGTYFFVRYGSQGAMMLVNKIFNRGGNNDTHKGVAESQAARTAVASSDALIQRARSLDFPAAPPMGAQAAPQQFAAQMAPQTNFAQPQTPTLRPRDTLGYGNAPANPAMSGFTGQQAPLAPSLSPSRPYQGGGLSAPAPLGGNFGTQGMPPQGNFGTQGMPPQQGNFGAQGLPPQQGNFGAQGLPPQQGNFGAQGLPPQGNFGTPSLRPAQGGLGQPPMPPQGNFQPLNPQQGQMRPPMPPQAGGFGNPAYPQQQQPPAQGANALGDYRPNLQPRGFANNQNTAPTGLRSRRDNNRRADDNEIYDDSDGGILGTLGL